jgi:hypothetical protein
MTKSTWAAIIVLPIFATGVQATEWCFGCVRVNANCHYPPLTVQIGRVQLGFPYSCWGCQNGSCEPWYTYWPAEAYSMGPPTGPTFPYWPAGGESAGWMSSTAASAAPWAYGYAPAYGQAPAYWYGK